jgi:hypothetical protein
MNNMIATATTATIPIDQQQSNLALSLKLDNLIKQEPFSMTDLIELYYESH